MANPGHALAAGSLAEIRQLKRELAQLRVQHQMAMTHLTRGIEEFMELLESKGVATKSELRGLPSLEIFMSMNHQQSMW